jgi:oxygen-independent coproporphyrinogen III oxidase
MFEVESLYLHFPYCTHLCNYCDFYKRKDEENKAQIESFESFLEESWTPLDKVMAQNGYRLGRLKTLYIGGGTPSLWLGGAKFIKQFLDKKNIHFADEYEFTIEFNPGDYLDQIQSWIDIGVNRFSIGIQSLNPLVFPYLDRAHTLEQSLQTLSKFSNLKTNFSCDLLLGAPHSDRLKRNIIEEIQELSSYGPKHFSLYILKVPKQYSLNKKLPSEEYIAREYEDMANLLSSSGFHHYEVSNFALKGHEAKHNQAYWQSRPMAALGPSATGYLPLKEGKALRFRWKVLRPELSLEPLSPSQVLLEKFYLEFRTSGGIKGEDFIATKYLDEWRKLSEGWAQNGWAQMTPSGFVQLTSQGFLLIDSLIGSALRYLKM